MDTILHANDFHFDHKKDKIYIANYFRHYFLLSFMTLEPFLSPIPSKSSQTKVAVTIVLLCNKRKTFPFLNFDSFVELFWHQTELKLSSWAWNKLWKHTWIQFARTHYAAMRLSQSNNRRWKLNSSTCSDGIQRRNWSWNQNNCKQKFSFALRRIFFLFGNCNDDFSQPPWRQICCRTFGRLC